MSVRARLVPSYTTCRWLLIPVVTMHNAEEWIAEPHYGSISPMLQTRVMGFVAPPPIEVLHIGWIIVTLIPALIVVSAASAGRSRMLNWLVCWVACAYLANALVPHLLEFAMSRSYAPGVVTAGFIVLPFAFVLLRRAVVERYLSAGQLVAAISAAVVSQVLVVAAIYAIASALTAQNQIANDWFCSCA